MRSRLAMIAVLASVFAVVAAVGFAAGPVTVADDFESGGYGGSANSSTGSWAGSWSEVGESDGPTAGDVQIGSLQGCQGQCLVVSGALFLTTSGAARTTEVVGAHTVDTSYKISFRALAAASVRVQANLDGAGWKTVATRSSSGSFSNSLGTTTGSVGIRFVVDGLSLGGSIGIDDVVLTLTPQPVETTSTTTTTATTTTGFTLPTITIPLPSTTLVLPFDTTTTTRPTDTTTTSTTPTEVSSTTTRPVDPPREDDDTILPPPKDGGTPTDVGSTRFDRLVLSFDTQGEPALATSRGPAYVVDSFLVRFGMQTEDLSLDLTLYLLLGAAIAIVLAMERERGFRGEVGDDEDDGPVDPMADER